ncbi:hypothetical protein LJR289_002411 [Pseudoduganella sp. LjRoot289]|uniref:hypothetical protein n=1 Tax=Pseudoduganella sp. LjRoot289 TaxID=3342314 RepID=UPI003ED07C03
MTSSRWIAAALCGMTISAGADGLPPGWTPVADSTLEAQRGGFDGGNGMLVSLGIERLVSINGGTVASSQFNIADLSRVTAGEALLAREAIQPFMVVQNGLNNGISLPDGAQQASQAMSALLIQNSVNDQLIRSQTTINASVSGLSMLTGINLESSMRAALSGALAPH